MAAGVTAKLAITAAAVVAVLILGGLLRLAVNGVARGARDGRTAFWTTQFLHVLTLVAILAAIVVVWRDKLSELGAVGGWFAAGLTVALQRVVTAFAGYVIILRGNLFTVGDRITIGGVRGDVVSLGFMQTTVMEMGQPPGEQADSPSMWVKGRQHTGRIVRITNDKVFDTPIYNYTREFPFLWDEITIPVRYQDDRRRVEEILLDVARRNTHDILRDAEPKVNELHGKYHLPERPEIRPKVFYHLTDNWLELSLRFLSRDRDVRSLKDTMNREILDGLEEAKIGLASGTYAIVEMPTLKVEQTRPLS
jgi:small-conductance mechanosensitive channel